MTKTELKNKSVMNPAGYWKRQRKGDQEREKMSPIVLQQAAVWSGSHVRHCSLARQGKVSLTLL